MLGEKALKNAGFKNFSVVKEQAVADPEFSTVKFPNPEFPEALRWPSIWAKRKARMS